jgi:hypothetical protein
LDPWKIADTWTYAQLYVALATLKAQQTPEKEKQKLGRAWMPKPQGKFKMKSDRLEREPGASN